MIQSVTWSEMVNLFLSDAIFPKSNIFENWPKFIGKKMADYGIGPQNRGKKVACSKFKQLENMQKKRENVSKS